MDVYDRGDFNVAACSAYVVGNETNSCTAKSDGSGYLWIKVSDVSYWNFIGNFSLSLE
jgi:hypothetical protein